MEDGDISITKVSETINIDETRDVLMKMANYPDVEVTVIKNKTTTDAKTSEPSENCTKVNGESEKNYSDEPDEYTSDEDTLVIDEETRRDDITPGLNNKRVRSPSPRANFKGFKKRYIARSAHIVQIVNDVLKTYHTDETETLAKTDKASNAANIIQGELNTSHEILTKTGTSDQKSNHIDSPKHKHVTFPTLKSSAKRTVKKRPSQKLTEYAQYLGLQPAVKFKCVKCSESSFPSLSALNEHQRYCLVQTSVSQSSAPAAAAAATTAASAPTSSSQSVSTTNFRVTRKVFLCSSCGTYYENCNLFLHMREVHRRYICLYCLGMFSLPEKLSHHLVTKHNCSPNHYASAEDFLTSYRESCFLVCCHCERVFSERDNFFNHICVEKRNILTEKACWSCGVKGSAAHTASCQAANDQPTTSSSHKSAKSTSTKSSQKSNKTQKNSAKTVEHITADSPSTTALIEPEINAAKHFMAEVSSSSISYIKTETESPAIGTPVGHNSPENKNTSDNITNEASETCSDANLNITETEHTEPSPSENLESSDDKTEEPKPEPKSEPETELKEEENLIKSDKEVETLNRKSDNEDIDEDELLKSPEPMSDSEDNNSNLENMEQKNQENKNEEGTEIENNLESISENCNKNQSTDSEELNPVHESEDQKDRDSDDAEPEETSNVNNIEAKETRKVPKVTLKLPPQGLIYSENESDDSEKLTMEVDENSDNESQDQDNSKPTCTDESEKHMNGIDDEKELSDDNHEDDDGHQIAGDEVPIVELELDKPLDKFSIESLLKICLGATIPTCVYCNHARKIAVNGKQLGLHAIAEHRFAATVNSITAEELFPKNFVARIKECLDDVETIYFSLEDKEMPDEVVKDENTAAAVVVSTFKRIYECFQCRYVTTIHKELYLHNRKMHAKTILLCIMCKSNFYSYSELICHLCPGEYVLNSETKFRCCMCESNDLPSAFRLMVHLRKRHHTCDVCLEGCFNQSKLSNHVWKHKLHHLCYRCGIAYRNKPDITKHLFWKHGTESVLCKKCLQKKWPHVYHFCIPPVSFVCEECNFSFSKAVYLKVHKRLHNKEKPHTCTEENCTEAFISKKLLLKHEVKHREPVPIENLEPAEDNKENIKLENENEQDTQNSQNKEISSETTIEENADKNPNSPEKEEEKKPKNIVDMIDELPALNLSESDSDDSDDEKPKSETGNQADEIKLTEEIKENANELLNSIITGTTNKIKEEEEQDIITSNTENNTLEDEQKSVPILDGIWDNFKNYQATIEKRDGFSIDLPIKTDDDDQIDIDGVGKMIDEIYIPDLEVILADHDYCVNPNEISSAMEIEEIEPLKTEQTTGMDHDYCTVNENNTINNNQTTETQHEVKRPTTAENVEEKKSKSPKKKSKQHTGSSSSSDSSSDSDTTSCSCGSKCSCSSSSGSSSSSSSSSDSDSSSSEGKRRILARRERRKERVKRKKESETSHVSNTSAVDVVATEDPLVSAASQIELPIQESDLDTEETETDEDFYDEHPQRLANKLLAEKRNQLALLAAVAPVSNGTILENSRPSTPSIPEETTTVKKKIKTKKRKKKSRSSTPKHDVLPHHTVAHNIPPAYNHHHHHHRTPVSLPSIHHPTMLIIPPPVISTPPSLHSTPEIVKTVLQTQTTTESGSETDSNVRSSKRRRVPNKFYGYSSDEEAAAAADKPPTIPVIKWRKSDLPSAPSHVTGLPQFVPPITIKNIPSPAPIIEPVRAPVIHHNEVAESDSDVENPRRKSTSESSDSNHDDSDSDTGQLHISQPPQYPSVSSHHPGMPMQGERTNENLYCYCQCPYDEVSEMIACDGKDCVIEWFHFECVGIMVPPKGKWFCPDCRKKSAARSEFFQT